MNFLACLFVWMFASVATPGSLASLVRVGDQVITSRDFQINLFLNEMENPLSDLMERRDPVKEITYEFLILKESQAMVGSSVSDADIQAYTQKFLKRVETDKLWKSMDVSTKELREHAVRKITVKRLLSLKLPQHLVEPSESAIQSYYQQNRLILGQKPLAEVREKIVNALRAQTNQGRFGDWMAAVTRTHGVIYYSGFKIQ